MRALSEHEADSDFAEDFWVNPSVVAEIPAGAAYLIIGVYDSFYNDNLDANSDFKVQVTVLPLDLDGPSEFWWFDGETPSGYELSTEISSSGGVGTAWSIVAGSDKATLSAASGSQVTITSIGASEAEGDITLRAQKGSKTTDYYLTSRTPDSLQAGTVTTTCDLTWRYDTLIGYTVLDQFAIALPSGVPLNEQWTTSVVNDYANADWGRDPPLGLNAPTASFADHIQGEDGSPTPTPICDDTGIDTTAVQHWGQSWHIGSTTPGVGRTVQTNTLQKLLGRALHTSITSPVP